MARNLSSAALDRITSPYGAAPILIVEVQWNGIGDWSVYTDRDRIVESSTFDSIIAVSESQDSQQITIKLSDADGALKETIDNVDIHKKPVRVYQWFEGLDPSDKFLLFDGQINTPIVWNEGDRTLTFDVIAKLEDAEVGFSMEEGQFLGGKSDANGKPWPLAFGTVLDVPALGLSTLWETVTGVGMGVRDPYLPAKLNAANALKCYLELVPIGAMFAGAEVLVGYTTKTSPSCLKNKCELVERHTYEINAQSVHQLPSLTIYGGERYPQGTLITLVINGARFRGTMNGNVFTITARWHPKVDDNGILLPNVVDEILSNCGLFGLSPTPQENIAAPAAGGPAAEYEAAVAASQRDYQRTLDYYNSIPTLGFFWIPAGSKVQPYGQHEVVYIANLLPSSVFRVSAYRQLPAGRKLVDVPEELYTVRVTDYETYQVTEVVFNAFLSTRDEGWEDEIFVSLESEVGPNIVDTIQWLIETYTKFDIDINSFNEVRALVDPMNANFAVLDRPNIMSLLSDICYQARLVLTLRTGVFYLRHMEIPPPAVETISLSDIEQNSFELFHSKTEDLVTKYVIEWKEALSQDKPFEAVLRNNIGKYGTQVGKDNYFIYNTRDNIERAGLFWLIRKSNTWRKVRFKTHLNKLNVETLDGVILDIPMLSNNPVLCICEKADFDLENRRIEFEFWTPIRVGSRDEYLFAWPPDTATEFDFDNFDVEGDPAPNFFTIAPREGHPLAQKQLASWSVSYNPPKCKDGEVENSIGMCVPKPKKPETGDSKTGEPDKKDGSGGGSGHKTGTDGQLIENEYAKKEAKDAKKEAGKAKETADEDEPGVPEVIGGACTVVVRVQYIFVTRVQEEGGIGTTDEPGATGRPAISNLTQQEFVTFNSLAMAITYRDMVNSMANAKFQNWEYVVGQEDLNVAAPAAIHSNNFNDEGCPGEPESADDRYVTGIMRVPNG